MISFIFHLHVIWSKSTLLTVGGRNPKKNLAGFPAQHLQSVVEMSLSVYLVRTGVIIA